MPNPPFDSGQFRTVLGHFLSGVTVISAIDPETKRPVGMAVGSFTSVSLDPPLVAFLPSHTASARAAIKASGSFCVNMLASDQESVSRVFSSKVDDRFVGLGWTPTSNTGSPRLDGALAWIDCHIDAIHEAGDHLIVVGAVAALGASSEGSPLAYYRGGYGRFEQ